MFAGRALHGSGAAFPRSDGPDRFRTDGRFDFNQREAHNSNVLESNTVEVSPSDADRAALLAVVADPSRWSVLRALSAGPRCVCDLQAHTPVAANLLSYHLKVLREAGLVSAARRGRWIDYALADDAQARVTAALPFSPISVPL